MLCVATVVQHPAQVRDGAGVEDDHADSKFGVTTFDIDARHPVEVVGKRGDLLHQSERRRHLALKIGLLVKVEQGRTS
jgi:hypothetical protein